jgi:CheY-like chemotaxis protein
MKLMLSKEGYCVTDIVATGEEAVEIALKTQPDLILMDINLRNRLDGINAFEQIKKTVDIPVVFVSTYADEDIIARATQSKPSGYIVKPFKCAQLIKGVEKALEWHRLRQ